MCVNARSFEHVDDIFAGHIARRTWCKGASAQPAKRGIDDARPGLDRRTRSVICLSSTISTRNWDEFKLHIRAAFNNGLTKDEIKEIILQCAIYAGVPPANHGFKLAQEVFDDMGI